MMAGYVSRQPVADDANPPYAMRSYLNSSDLMMTGTTLVSSITLPIST